uniref:Uncharacterized protein n=1 Tax=Setaria italica TaxID=4555 RepID=K3YXN9_SETIT
MGRLLTNTNVILFVSLSKARNLCSPSLFVLSTIISSNGCRRSSYHSRPS